MAVKAALMSGRDGTHGGPGARAAQLQDAYLAEIKRCTIAVTVYLVNGFQLRGVIKGFDQFTIVLEYEHRAHLIYKHAVSTISPQGPIPPDFSLDELAETAAR
jgi:host factor-I protein